jgi:hypothetical protein
MEHGVTARIVVSRHLKPQVISVGMNTEHLEDPTVCPLTDSLAVKRHDELLDSVPFWGRKRKRR